MTYTPYTELGPRDTGWMTLDESRNATPAPAVVYTPYTEGTS